MLLGVRGRGTVLANTALVRQEARNHLARLAEHALGPWRDTKVDVMPANLSAQENAVFVVETKIGICHRLFSSPASSESSATNHR